MHDAAHVDESSFYARLPAVGRWCRLAGLLLVAAAAVLLLRRDEIALGWLMAGAVTAWLGSWRLGVGALWRSSLVAAVLAAATGLAALKLGAVP
jgi:hypothetical protein